MRRKLYDQLTACITEMEGMPFTERAHRITVSMHGIKTHETTAKYQKSVKQGFYSFEQNLILKMFLSRRVGCMPVVFLHMFQQCTEKLMNHYDNFLNVPVESHADFQTAVTQYEDFKVGQSFQFFSFFNLVDTS